MDENKRNIRFVKTGGRKVTKTTTEYKNRETAIDRRISSGDAVRKKRSSQLQEKVRYQKQQKAKRLKIQRRRTLIVFSFAVILVIVLLFMTPIFNIRSVSVEGNRLVSPEEFTEKLQPLIGENLLRTGRGKIRKTLKSISYIDTVDVQKKVFPPSVKVIVTEYVPVAVVRTEGNSLLINSSLHVLADSGEGTEPIPVVVGFNVNGYKLGGVLETDDSEKKDIVATMLSTLEATELVDKIMEINVENITDITMNYDNRITIKCGTQLDLERKLRLFRETVRSNSIAENVHGTMDLSEPGKAVLDRD